MNRIAKNLIVLLGTLLVTNTSYAGAWKLARTVWTEQDEKIYGNFVEKLCDSRYGNLNKFIKDPKANPLYGEEDKNFNLAPDCADLPYMIRAYVAYKLRLPFGYVSSISGNGGDERYSKGNKPASFKDQDSFSSPQKLFYQVALVNSGYYRMAATCETSDHYPIKISRKSLTPGTIYYDPDGHVALVAKVYDNGRIRLIDAHPDKSISKPWFGTKFSKGNKNNGGGFRKWRQIRYTSDGKIIRTQNHNLQDYSATDQYAKSYTYNGKRGLSYHEYVRLAMASSGARSDPMSEFVYMMQDIFEDIRYRAMAVDVAIQKGTHLKPHPGRLPFNIYGTDGLWEELSTPSRDARLKVAFREFYDQTRTIVMNTESQDPQMARSLAYAFLLKYDELTPKMCIAYTNSAGQQVVLSFADINKRLFDLSFDPYHSIEYRWGATGQELATAHDGETKRKMYAQEKRLRNQLERVYGCNTPLSMGPEYHCSVDVRGWLYAYLQGNQVDRRIIAFNKEIISDAPQNEENLQTQEQVLVAEVPKITQKVEQPQQPVQIAEVPKTAQKVEQPKKSIQVAKVVKETQEVEQSQKAETSLQTEPQPAHDNVSTTEAPVQVATIIQPKKDFWGSLLNTGDQLAAAASNSFVSLTLFIMNEKKL